MRPNDVIAPKDGQLDGASGVKDGKKEKKKKRGKQSWHLNKKIRKVARLEVSDAFDGQGKVIVVMAALMIFLVVGFWVGMRWIWRSVFG